jgi:hypothetical protein
MTIIYAMAHAIWPDLFGPQFTAEGVIAEVRSQSRVNKKVAVFMN